MFCVPNSNVHPIFRGIPSYGEVLKIETVAHLQRTVLGELNLSPRFFSLGDRRLVFLFVLGVWEMKIY